MRKQYTHPAAGTDAILLTIITIIDTHPRQHRLPGTFGSKSVSQCHLIAQGDSTGAEPGAPFVSLAQFIWEKGRRVRLARLETGDLTICALFMLVTTHPHTFETEKLLQYLVVII